MVAVPNYTLKCTLYITYTVVSHYFKLLMPNLGYTRVLRRIYLFGTAEQFWIFHHICIFTIVSCMSNTHQARSDLRFGCQFWWTTRLSRQEVWTNEYAQSIQTPDNSCTHFNIEQRLCAKLLTFHIADSKAEVDLLECILPHQNDAAPPNIARLIKHT